jgi:glycosyltransferase involved in cell wall biosynthesis
MSPLRLLTYTTLFPNRERPNHGIFVENRLRDLLDSGQAESTVLAPVPFFPSSSPRFGDWARHAKVPAFETRGGLAVHHPRYPVIPKLGMSLAPWLLYQASARALRRLLAQGRQFDLIDAHYFYPDGVAAVWLGRRFRLPVVVTARGSDVTLLPKYAVPRTLLRRAVKEADAIIAVSAALKAALVGLGAAPDAVEVLRNGVDTTLFRPADRATARSKLGLTRPTLISVGLLVERKGHHRVIEAMRLLPGHELLILGEGPERARLEGLIAKGKLGGRVRLLGSRPHAELPLFYSAADALVLASSREGWANVLLEAMACGTPVVASPIPGNPEVVQAQEAGVIAPANSPDGIVAGVRALFAAPRDRAATRAYAERFSWDATTLGQIALFRRVLAAGTGQVGRASGEPGGIRAGAYSGTRQ